MTKSKHINSKQRDIKIVPDSPFQNDALHNREQYAQLLTKVINLYGTEGCVLSINGEWGTGKTTFIKMWQQQLINDGYRTVYFNAWEFDYTENPLVAIISELKDISHDSETYKKIAACVGKISLSVIIALAKGAIKNWLKIDTDEIIDAGSKAIEDFGKKELDEFENQKQTLVEFKQLLSEYVATWKEEGKQNSPVVFFIDELDRCNPNYAVRTLEIIKHLFDVPNIIFVMAVNKEQLSYAVQGYYGSSNMNSMEYLRRFIDIEFNLPEGDIDQYCKYLYDYYGFDDFFDDKERRRNQNNRNEEDEFISIAGKICKHKHLSLRTIGKIFSQCRLSLEDFTSLTILEPSVFFYLCMLKVTNTVMYNSIQKRKYSYQDLFTTIIEDLPDSLTMQKEDSENTYTNDARLTNWLIAGLLFLYVNYDGRPEGEAPWKNKSQDNQNPKYELSIKYENVDIEGINNAITWYNKNQYRLNMGLKPIIERIELLKVLDFNR